MAFLICVSSKGKGHHLWIMEVELDIDSEIPISRLLRHALASDHLMLPLLAQDLGVVTFT